MTKLFLSLDDAVRVAVREFDLGDFIEFGKKAFGVELTFKKSDDPDTYEKLFGTSQEPKTGHWIYLKHNKARCSVCDDVVLIAQMYGNANYCPNCGTKMIEPQESEVKE